MIDVAEATEGELGRAVASRAGDAAQAEAEIYRRFAPRVRLYGLRHLRDEDAARDLAQEVLLLTIQKLRDGEVRDPDHLASFVLGTSRMMAEGRRRTERRRERLLAAHASEMHAPPEAGAPSLDLDRVATCVDRLSERERLVVVLTFYAEQPSDTVARRLDTSPGNVRVIRHRALDRVRKCLESREVAR